jgi:hypothetical protein
MSGVAAKRPELERVLDELKAGDMLVVTRLDRLARSTLDPLRVIDRIGRRHRPQHPRPDGPIYRQRRLLCRRDTRCNCWMGGHGDACIADYSARVLRGSATRKSPHQKYLANRRNCGLASSGYPALGDGARCQQRR